MKNMSNFVVEPGRDELGEYKVTADWNDMINTLSQEFIDNLDKYNQLATAVLYAVPERYQKPNWEIIDWNGNINGRYQLDEVWVLKAHPDQIKNIKANLRITRKD